jgi:hypothetical protein
MGIWIQVSMDLYLFFRLVLCFLHGKMKSFELDLGSKPRNQHETSPDLPDRKGGGGLLFTSKFHCKYGFTETGRGLVFVVKFHHKNET